ncbi:hypothetical protein [Methylocystis parvus]|uniref:hypothetical protein n=1 Tax=Methylocystis parvus TaxID=134 RepID=UPI003C751FEC
MASLLDIAPIENVVCSVTVRGRELETPGLGIGAIAALVARFPVLQSIFSQQEGYEKSLDIARLGPEVASAIIASGTGRHFSAEHEEAAKRLLPDEQLRVLTAIWKATAPNGPRPLAEALVEAGLFDAELINIVDRLLAAIDGARKTSSDSQSLSSS